MKKKDAAKKKKEKFLTGRMIRSGLKWLAIIAVVISLISALWVNFGIRAPIEAKNKTVGLLVDYDELTRLADGVNDATFSDMVRKTSLAGATGLVIRERLLSEWEVSGELIVLSGGQLRFQLENKTGEPGLTNINASEITPNKTYILTKIQLVYDQIFALLNAKARHPEPFNVPGYMCIAVQLHSSERATLGFGFPISQLEQAAAAGFQIIPRLRNWEPMTEASLKEVFNWVSKIPNVAAIGFNDQTVPGDGTNPIKQDLLANAVSRLKVPLVSFEFYDQIGLPGLADRLDNNLIRAHAIADNEMRKYSEFDAAMDRYSLAASERNIRYIYLRFQGLANPGFSLENNLELLAGVHDGLVADGLTIGYPEPIPSFSLNRVFLFLLGIGIIAAGAWLIALVLEPFAKKKWYLPYGILAVAGCLVWAAFMIMAPTLSRIAFALAGAIIFPGLGVTLVLKHEPKKQEHDTDVKRTLRAILQLLLMSVITLAGAMIISALLVDTRFMLRLDIFRGTKVSHIIPLILVPCVLWIRENNRYNILSGSVKSNIKFWQLIVGAVILAGFVIYVMRTGNESADLVSGLEVQFRQLLKDVLGVRPRTKEFLIGHPLMLVLLYYGYKINLFPLVIGGLIGQVSIINTYAHIHTPVTISLLRTANGLWIGILIGIVAIILIECIHRGFKKLNAKHA